MFTNVFTKTFRDQLRGLIGWGIGVALTVAVMAAIWPSFSDIDLDALLSQYPDSMKQLFNVTEMGTGSGYMNAELFSLMLPAIFVVYAVGRGARLVAGEEESGTLDLLATMPITRRRILFEKCGALVVDLGVLAVVLLASTYLSSSAFGMGIGFVDSLNGAIAMFLLGLEFGLVAVALSAGTGRHMLAVGISAGFAGASYLLYLAAQLIESLHRFRVFSPFYQAVSRGPIGPSLAPMEWSMLAVGLLALAISVPVFERRDLAT